MASQSIANLASNRDRLSFARIGSSRIALTLAMSSLGLAVLAQPAAADSEWHGTTSTDWFNAANWNNGVPAAGDEVLINTTSPHATTINANAFAAGVYIGTTAGAPGLLTIEGGGTLTSVEGIVGNGLNSTVTIDGNGSAWTNSGKLTIGSSGIGTLTISNGGAATNTDGTLGDSIGSQGSATITGPASSWTNTSDLVVGDLGTGTLEILDGGIVSSTNGYIAFKLDSTGSVTVSGVGSKWTIGGSMTVGWEGNGAVTISDNGVVTADYGNIGLFAGGVGAVTVDGTGSALNFVHDLVLGYSGGSGSLTIQNGGTVTDVNGTLGSQPGSTGIATVTGAGSTWTNTGDFAVGQHAAGTLFILDGGVVTSVNGQVGHYADGSGTVVVAGTGSKWVNTANFYLGGGSAGDGPGAMTIADGGMVSIGGSFIIADGLASTGSLNIGAGAGSAAAGAGSLNAATVQFGNGTGTINFNHTDSAYTFASIIDGAVGSTVNQLSGTTILTGNSAAYFGATNVTGGRLAVNGSLAGSVVMVSGSGTLGGNGTVGGIVAQSGGIIGPGNSIGTLNVAGNLAQAAASVYQVELTSTGTSDLIHATGTATLASGASINVVKLDAAPLVVGTHYMVLQADGGIAGTYTLTGETGSAFLGLVDSYDLNHVYLDVITKTFAQVGLTANQIAAGAGAESLGAGDPLYDAIALLPNAAAAQAAFDQVSGEIHASIQTALVEDTRFLREAAVDRLRVAFAEPAAPRNDTAGANSGIWGRGFGSLAQWNGDGNAATMSRSTGGMFIGADGTVGDNWRLGVIGGFGHSNFGVGARNSTAQSNDYHVGLYGGTEWGDLALRSGLAYSWHDIDTSRSPAFAGFANTLAGDYSAGTTQAFGELGYRMTLDDVTIEPFANLAYVNLSSSGFRETGGAGALDVAADGTNAAFVTLGMRASTSFKLANATVVTARGMLGWRHAFGDTTPTSNMAFAGGSAFTIAGVPTAGDAALIDLGLDFAYTPGATFGVAYGGQLGSASFDQTIKGTLNVKF